MPQGLGARLADRALAETPTQIPLSALLVVKGHYDFAVQGGAQGTIALTEDTPIPNGAIVVGGVIEVTRTLTGTAGATIAINAEGAADLVTAMILTTWTTGARLNVKAAPTAGSGTASTSIKTTAARDLSATVAVHDLTDGAFDVYLYLIVP